MSKIELRVKADADLLARAEANGVALDAALEEGIKAILLRQGQASELQRRPSDVGSGSRQWALENAAAIKSHERFVEEHGAFGDDLRTW